MLTFNSLKELEESAVAEEVILEVTQMLEKAELQQDINFSNDLGGFVCIVETHEDITEIENGELWKNPISFDVAYILASKEWVFLFMATNNAGGHSYFIPMEIADLVPNIKKSVIESNNGEEMVASTRGKLSIVRRIAPFSGKFVERLIPTHPAEIATEHYGNPLTKDELSFIDRGAILPEFEELHKEQLNEPVKLTL
jgi:hypothetical protein